MTSGPAGIISSSSIAVNQNSSAPQQMTPPSPSKSPAQVNTTISGATDNVVRASATSGSNKQLHQVMCLDRTQ
jgi:hypothetical protein